jgi:8-oxo-dGTP diphosphatase
VCPQDSCSGSPAQPIAIAVVVRSGCVLVGRRETPPLEGYAEFPGGKPLPGEPLAEAAEREVLEECGVAVRAERLLSRIEGAYPHARLDLHFFLCRPEDAPGGGDGEPLVRRPFAWLPITSLDALDFPPANAEALAALRAITP